VESRNHVMMRIGGSGATKQMLKDVQEEISGPEVGTSCIDWAQLSRLLPED
jgi:hypothetical protein